VAEPAELVSERFDLGAKIVRLAQSDIRHRVIIGRGGNRRRRSACRLTKKLTMVACAS
jgi:hypothetical protein